MTTLVFVFLKYYSLSQVLTRKAMPHVIYCGIWRWPDLHSHHELEAIDTCQFPFEANLETVCINPYHYTRIESPVLPPVFVPCYFDLQYSILSPSESEIPPPAYSSSIENMNSNSFDKCFTSVTAIYYEELSNWATIAYYEFNWRVGHLFQCNTRNITVDGCMNRYHSAGQRFCLGYLSNNNRSIITKRIRYHIGLGIEFVYVGGALYAENKSMEAVFIQSPNYNLYNGFYWNKVCKLPPASSLRIFDYQYFGELLSESIYYGFDSVRELVKMCTIRVSFVKGWGLGYLIQDILSSPCWLEIHLTSPFNWCDQVMAKLNCNKTQ